MTTLDERIAHHESELARLRAERDSSPDRMWINWYPSRKEGYAYLTLNIAEKNSGRAIIAVEYVRADKVRDEPFVVTDSVVSGFWGARGRVSEGDRINLAKMLTCAGIPAVAEGVGS